jgi:DNA-binding GntR family transcriptional regulator
MSQSVANALANSRRRASCASQKIFVMREAELAATVLWTATTPTAKGMVVEAEASDGDRISSETLEPEVYQAQGAVAVYLNISVAEAVLRMKAHAVRHDQSLADLARLILAGEVVLEAAED